jgi:very-short-patch-repair endonuclease
MHRNRLDEDETKTKQMINAGYKVLRFIETSKSTSKKGRDEYEYAKNILLDLLRELGGTN